MKRGGGGQRGKAAGGAGGDHEVVHGASDGPVFGTGGGDMAVHGVEEVGGAEDGEEKVRRWDRNRGDCRGREVWGGSSKGKEILIKNDMPRDDTMG